MQQSTSLAIKIASTLSSRYLDGEGLFKDVDNNSDSKDYLREFIPVLLPLKDVIDESGFYLEEKLQDISMDQESKKRNILLICDGLDEYNFEEDKLKQALDRLSTEDKYPNIKFLITTRLEAGIRRLPTGLKNYVRLLPFNESQVNKFFERYGLPQYNIEKIKGYGLGDEEASKPLFCWTLTLNNSNTPLHASFLLS